ncbi:hypothetical protein AVEN_105285-1 [Araneus ventricosus]|uniref:Uncharacterized protein n=1 Tax=Araneus ventricosus TaxID=182803 RepID=A0A4Y2TAE1_ARAVE|nr:hypothetical protein AVEN_105285-1 [Araneus ventricosus]
MKQRKLSGGRLCSSPSSSIPFLASSSPLILAKNTISLTIGSTGKELSQNTQFHIRKQSPAKASSKQKCGFFSNIFPCIFDHFEAGNDVEVIFAIFSGSKVGP